MMIMMIVMLIKVIMWTKMSERCVMNDRGDDENDDAEHDDDDDEDEDDDDDDDGDVDHGHHVEDDHMSSSKSYKISGCGSSNPV